MEFHWTPYQALNFLSFVLAVYGGFALVKRVVQWRIKSLDMIGATFVHIDQRGCMADDRAITWVGVGKSIGWSRWSDDGAIFIEIVQQAHMPNDIRDGGQGGGEYAIRDSSIQKIAPGLYFIFR